MQMPVVFLLFEILIICVMIYTEESIHVFSITLDIAINSHSGKPGIGIWNMMHSYKR